MFLIGRLSTCWMASLYGFNKRIDEKPTQTDKSDRFGYFRSCSSRNKIVSWKFVLCFEIKGWVWAAARRLRRAFCVGLWWTNARRVSIVSRSGTGRSAAMQSPPVHGLTLMTHHASVVTLNLCHSTSWTTVFRVHCIWWYDKTRLVPFPDLRALTISVGNGRTEVFPYEL